MKKLTIEEKIKKVDLKVQIKKKKPNMHFYLFIYAISMLVGLIESGWQLTGLVTGLLISIFLSFSILICLIPFVGLPLYIFWLAPTLNGFVTSLSGIETYHAYWISFIVFGIFGAFIAVILSLISLVFLGSIIGSLTK